MIYSRSWISISRYTRQISHNVALPQARQNPIPDQIRFGQPRRSFVWQVSTNEFKSIMASRKIKFSPIRSSSASRWTLSPAKQLNEPLYRLLSFWNSFFNENFSFAWKSVQANLLRADSLSTLFLSFFHQFQCTYQVDARFWNALLQCAFNTMILVVLKVWSTMWRASTLWISSVNEATPIDSFRVKCYGLESKENRSTQGSSSSDANYLIIIR